MYHQCGRVSIAVLLLVVASAAQRRPHESFAAVEDQPRLPRVLLLGDSISMSYTLPVRELLHEKANVHRPPDNCRSTRYTLERLEGWLGQGKWDVIHMNWGIHDATYLDATGRGTTPDMGQLQVPLEEYEANLNRLLDRLAKTGARLIWCTTTPIGAGARSRREADIQRYNAAALAIMRGRAITINDLHGFASGHEDWQSPDGVHFLPEGARRLAVRVADAITAALAR